MLVKSRTGDDVADGVCSLCLLEMKIMKRRAAAPLQEDL